VYKLVVIFAFVGLLRKAELVPGLTFAVVVVTPNLQRVEVTIRKSKHRNKPFIFYLLKHDNPDLTQ